MYQKAFMLTTQHRYHIRARPTGPCMGWGWDLRSRSRSFIGDVRFNVRGEHVPGCLGRGWGRGLGGF